MKKLKNKNFFIKKIIHYFKNIAFQPIKSYYYILHSIFTLSLVKSDMFPSLAAHLTLDKPHFKCPSAWVASSHHIGQHKYRPFLVRRTEEKGLKDKRCCLASRFGFRRRSAVVPATQAQAVVNGPIYLKPGWQSPLLQIREDLREERQGSSRPRCSVPFCPGSPQGGSSVPPSPRHGGLSMSVYPHGNQGRGQKTLCGWRMSP